MKKRRDRGTRGDTLRFFVRAGKLKTEPRLGWFVKLGMQNPESVADHSYRTALMSMVFSDIRGLDAEKAMKIALLHDLAEAVVGDSIPGQRSAAEKRLAESAALRSLVSDLPAALALEYTDLWVDYEEGLSQEAKLVKGLDKLEMAVQASEYRHEDPRRDVAEFMESARRATSDPELKKLLKRLG